MSSTWGDALKISIFGESHGPAVGVVIDGLPAGETINREELLLQMSRRAPGKDPAATTRKEPDVPEVLSGLLNGRTTGAPLCAMIPNQDTHSGDYSGLSSTPRPGHADYTAYVRYGGHSDFRGGGHFSGRLTAPLVFAGAVCRQILAGRGITSGAHLSSAGGIDDLLFNPADIDEKLLKSLSESAFPVLSPEAGNRMREEIEKAKLDGDSVGGTVECAVIGLAPGIGNPMFGGLESKLASLIFGIPAVKGLEFGDGFQSAGMRGSRNNDPFCYEGGSVRTSTNHNGGILGGISTGMPLVFRAAFKPTPSIFKPQRTVDLSSGEETTLQIHGRHDPCVAVRAVPVVEAAACVCLLDCCLEDYGYGFKH